MHDRHALCQVESDQNADVGRISTLTGDISAADNAPGMGASNPGFEHSNEYDPRQGYGPLAVTASRQWATTTAGRIVNDTYSWLQSVHWVHGTGAAPVPPKGPKFGPTTIRIAQELTKLTEVRPGITHLMRVLNLGERTVQYHLAHLRNTGLLTYIEVGTRLPRTEDRGPVARSSHFALTIPQNYDTALGIRTTGEGPTRRMTGIAEAGRKTIARLGRLASKSVRRRKRKTSPRQRCTPMVASSAVPALTHSPSASRLEGKGPKDISTKGKSGRHRNRVTRRFELAAELRRRVLWMSRSNTDRLAWVLSEVADAGWTATEVEAWLNLVNEPGHVRRPSGLLASRLRAAVLLWPTKAHRDRAMESQRERIHGAAKARSTVADGFLACPESTSDTRPAALLDIIALCQQTNSRVTSDGWSQAEQASTMSEESAAADIAAFLGAAV
ncbi:transcriptional regulator (plasmid) [Kitasatospora sp. NBC_01246]|uniref:transcriptional regulator n=1 Tax=Kitasatospora sp. NBC_01246 TaxID=2903570 RepID=UPI002E36EAE5|nr:transcriptional regulator [Kitasatospora sp. NBC_01246]